MTLNDPDKPNNYTPAIHTSDNDLGITAAQTMLLSVSQSSAIGRPRAGCVCGCDGSGGSGGAGAAAAAVTAAVVAVLLERRCWRPRCSFLVLLLPLLLFVFKALRCASTYTAMLVVVIADFN